MCVYAYRNLSKIRPWVIKLHCKWLLKKRGVGVYFESCDISLNFVMHMMCLLMQ